MNPDFSLKYRVESLPVVDGKIEILLKLHEIELSRAIIGTQERAIRKRLIQLGWTPPPEAPPQASLACGHVGLASIYPDPNGAVECTCCSNARRGFRQLSGEPAHRGIV
jgi:hypothetical protein